jgi:protein-tyrosine phosphatase
VRDATFINEERVLRLGGTRNLRDVGGYPTIDGRRTRWRTLYRSDCLDRLDADGQARLVQAGLRSVIDLRDDEEVAARPNVFASSKVVAYVRAGLFATPPPPDLVPDLHHGYRREVDLLGTRLANLVETVVRPGTLPTLLHCAAGKDRTGLSVAVLLAAAGVCEQAIAEDYALSEACLGPEYVVETRRWVEARGWNWAAWEHTVVTPPERMPHTLEYLEVQYGGVRQYLLSHGLAPAALEALREVLTEPI